MISIERLKEIEPTLAKLTDGEIRKIRRLLYQYAVLVLEIYLEKTTGSKLPVGSLEFEEDDMPE
jgi:hypothetical protein